MVLQGNDSGEKGKDWNCAALICACLDPVEMREVTPIQNRLLNPDLCVCVVRRKVTLCSL